MAKLHGNVEKLPKWAQDYIKDLIRERENAVTILNEFQDSQTPSKVFYEERACTGEVAGTNCPVTKRRYVPARSITFLVGKPNQEREVYVTLHEELGLYYLDVSAGFGSLRFQPVSGNSNRIDEPKR